MPTALRIAWCEIIRGKPSVKQPDIRMEKEHIIGRKFNNLVVETLVHKVIDDQLFADTAANGKALQQ